MKRLTIIALSLLTLAGCKTTTPVIPADKQIEKSISKLMRGMSLEDKVGQMCQLTLTVIEGSESFGAECISEALLDSVITKYRVGNMINVPSTAAQTPEQWASIVNRIQEKSLEEIGIPCLYGVDMIHGASYTIGSTIFPQGINLGASFNPQLAHDGSVVSAYETRACGVPLTFAPVMDLGRNPCWSRQWESFGEDPLVNARMAEASVRGLQGEDLNHVGIHNVSACIKHFMGYGVPVSGKDRTPSSIQPNDLREKFFAPFLASLQAGALSLMVSSSSNGSLPYHANREILTGWVKEELGWDGLIMTDWADIENLYTRDHMAVDSKDAIRIAINAGIDLAMVPGDWHFCTYLKELVEEGKVPMSRINDAVRRVLRLKYRLGLFEKPFWTDEDYSDFASASSAELSLKAAEETMVLLKNEDSVLPLRKGQKILVTGPNANAMRCLNGGWSYSWQGEKADQYTGEFNTIYEALCNKFGASNVMLEQGVTYPPYFTDWWVEEEPHIEQAVAAARKADVIVACIGENSYCETPGNLNELSLSENQTALVKALASTGKPIVLILNEGRPRVIRSIEPLAKAVVDILLPGNYGGDALANLLAADVNFSAKLPFTYPMYTNSLNTYDYKTSELVGTMSGDYNYNARVDVQWPFGYGLSYTSFEYSDLKTDRTEFGPEDVINVEVTVTNTGCCAGKEAVLLYSSDLVASIMPDAIRLRDFTKIELQSGESQVVRFALPASELAFVNLDGRWTVEEGDFRLVCGGQSTMIHCNKTKIWKTPNR